jgi:hypothetical protein
MLETQEIEKAVSEITEEMIEMVLYFKKMNS